MDPQQNPEQIVFSFRTVTETLFINPWPWWAAGVGIALTLLAFIWFTGRKAGVSSGYGDVCKGIDRKMGGKYPPIQSSRLWFLLGIPLGALLANAGWWNWTWAMGRMDQVSAGSLLVKIVLLFLGGILLGLGARWAGGCMTGQALMGLSTGNKASWAVTASFLAAGYFMAFILFKVL